MLQSISWQQFLLAISSIVIVYYIVVAVLFFRDEFIALLKGQGRAFRQAEIPGDENDSTNDVMGKVLGETAQQDEQLPILPSNPDDPDDLTVRSDESVGAVADLLEQIKILHTVINDKQPTRREVKALFESLLQRYPQFAGTPYQYPISESIANSCNESLHLIFSVTEVLSWWPQSESSNSINS